VTITDVRSGRHPGTLPQQAGVADFVRVSTPHDVDGAAVTIRPIRIRRVCWVLAPIVVIVFVVLGLALSGPISEGRAVFQASDRVAMMGLGVLAALAILAFTRPKVTADGARIKIQNVIGGYDLPWQVVRAVRFDRGSPWLTLELHDDDVIAVMAVQAADRERAVDGARALRALHAASVSASTPEDTAPG